MAFISAKNERNISTFSLFDISKSTGRIKEIQSVSMCGSVLEISIQAPFWN